MKRHKDTVVYLQTIDEILWQEIDRLIFENGFPYIVDEKEYEKLLAFIYKRLRRTWFKKKTPTPQEFKRRLMYYYKRKRTELLAVLSYLIAQYYNYKAQYHN